MARKSPSEASYAHLVVSVPSAAKESPIPPAAEPDPAPAAVSAVHTELRGRGRPKTATTLRAQAVQLGVYVTPAFRRALNIYAAESDLKPHDCLLEALEEWARKKKIAAPVRVDTEANSKRGGKGSGS